jgi:hypothetical protein
MKIVTNDYGCGTSSSILDYNTDNVIVVSEQNHKHLFDIRGEDLLFIGHDFLMYLWDSPLYRSHWKNYKGNKHIYCFEKIDCIVPEWQKKSHYSLSLCQQFTNSFYASDEQDCRKYGIKWLPQWASRRFYDERMQPIQENRITFSGQAGTVGYEKRDELMALIGNDPDLKDKFYVSNKGRTKSWDEYVENFLNHKVILAPFGNFKGFNTRTYEALISGRILLQQVDSEYKWHVDSISKFKNVIFFQTFEELKDILLNIKRDENDYNVHLETSLQFEENNFLERLQRIK